MNRESQNRAIASIEQDAGAPVIGATYPPGSPGEPINLLPVKDYLSDRNALHRAVGALNNAERKRFSDLLGGFVIQTSSDCINEPGKWLYAVWDAPPSMVAEALLKAAGKWEDEQDAV